MGILVPELRNSGATIKSEVLKKLKPNSAYITRPVYKV